MTRLTHWLVPLLALVSTSACSSDSNDSNAQAGPAFCGNDACDGSESPSTCPHDCPASCGDQACTGSEHCQSCAEDCGACAPGCGDGTCNVAAGESCSSCAPDCGQCADVCGDGACGPSETCSSCAGDCGACPGTGGSGGGGAGGSGGTSSGGNGGTSSGGTSSGGTSSGGSSGTGGSGTGTSCYGGSWTAPLGIPCPSFGIAEQAGPTTLVVNNSNGIPDVIPAGTVIEIQGTYSKNHTSPNDFTCAGTAAKPVFIRGAAGSMITGGWEVHGSYCILENLHFGQSGGNLGGMLIVAPADHIALRNSEIAGDSKDYGGTGVVSWDNSKATDIVLYKNFIHDGGDINAGFDQDVHGIGVSENVHHLWVLENEVTKNSGDGIQVNGSTNGLSETHHIYIGKNHFHHNKQAGIGVKQASDVILSENDSHDHRPSDSSGGDCITAQYGPERLWVIYNRLHACDSGVKLASDSVNNPGKDQYFVGNVIYDVHSTAGFNPNTGYSEACIALWGGTNRYIVNNTCSDADSGVRSPSSNGTFLVANNIFSGIVPAGHHLFRESGPAMQSRRNLTDVALKQVGAGTCTNCVVGNPGFKAAAAGDFALNASSAAIDAAAEEAVYATFQTLYGLDIRRDAGGNPRPQGANWDIGAYEAP